MSYKKIHGHNLEVGFAEGAAFALGKSCSVDIRQSFIETSDPQSGGWKRHLPTTAEWSMACNGLYSRFTQELRSAQASRRAVLVRFTDKSNSCEYYGEAYIETLQTTGSVKELATYSVRLKGNGPLHFESEIEDLLHKVYVAFMSSVPQRIAEIVRENHASYESSGASKTVTVPASGTGYKHVYIVMPSAISLTGVTQPDALDAQMGFTLVSSISDGVIIYKIYESNSRIDCSIGKKITIE